MHKIPFSSPYHYHRYPNNWISEIFRCLEYQYRLYLWFCSMNSVSHTNFIRASINTHAYCVYIWYFFFSLPILIEISLRSFVFPLYLFRCAFIHLKWRLLVSFTFESIHRQQQQTNTIQNESIYVQCLHNEQTELKNKILHYTASKRNEYETWNSMQMCKWTCFQHCVLLCICVYSMQYAIVTKIYLNYNIFHCI